jgi:hypothetical protein
LVNGYKFLRKVKAAATSTVLAPSTKPYSILSKEMSGSFPRCLSKMEARNSSERPVPFIKWHSHVSQKTSVFNDDAVKAVNHAGFCKSDLQYNVDAFSWGGEDV